MRVLGGERRCGEQPLLLGRSGVVGIDGSLQSTVKVHGRDSGRGSHLAKPFDAGTKELDGGSGPCSVR